MVENKGIAQGNVTAGGRDAAAFATTVVEAAQHHGIDSEDVFVTGHSLGAIQAEYAAQQTGLAGIGFESTGLPRSATTAGDGTNFVNVVQYGDPVANYSSDIAAEQPFAPAYAAGGTGDPAAEASLSQAAAVSALLQVASPAGVGVTTALYGVGLAAYHVPNVQAYNLGIDLTQYGASEVSGVRSGTVLDAGDDTIQDLIDATSTRLSAPHAPGAAVSPVSGASSGAAARLLHAGAEVGHLTHLDATAALVDHLLLPAGGIGAAGPGHTDTALERLFITGESNVSAALSHALDAVGSAQGLSEALHAATAHHVDDSLP